MLNASYKIKYIVLIALLPALLFLSFTANVAMLKNTENRVDFASDVTMDFSTQKVSDAVISNTYAEIFGRYAELVRIKTFARYLCGLKTAVTAKYKFIFSLSNIYTPFRIPYYTETCMILSQIIITFIFMKDGKKRSNIIIRIS